MSLTLLDWGIVLAYFALSIGIGLTFTKKGGESLEEYFVAGRSVPWWLAGSAMIATTFAADTPLVVTGLVASHGVAGNWLWWNMVLSGTLTVFLYARLWRRARVMTDVEFAEIRYAGRPASFLRGFRAIYLALPINLIIMGWVTLAMVKILGIALGVSPIWAVGICFVVTVAYSAAAGMRAVLWTDLVQLGIMMTAVIVLAVYAVDAVGGMGAMKTGVAAHFGSLDAALSVVPPAGSPWMPAIALFTFLAVQWWAAWYPGAEPGGGGYVAQRIFSAKTERDGILATLFFNVGHYAFRPWPWIITGLCTVLLAEGFSPEAADAALEGIRNREGAGSTSFGAVALPHARVGGLGRIVGALGANASGVFDSGHAGIRIVLAFASPASATVEHLQFLAQVARLLRQEETVADLLDAKDPAGLLEAIRRRER